MDSTKAFYSTDLGSIFCCDSFELLKSLESDSVDLIITSPPFDLIKKKPYGNLQGEQYQRWMIDQCEQYFRVLKPTGSLVIDLGGGWNQGSPTKNLYEYRLLLALVDDIGFFLAQDCFWWDPSRLPTPAQWVNVTRERLKDAVNKIWWLSKTPHPKSDNRAVLQKYSAAMQKVLNKGTNTGTRKSGHKVSEHFNKDNGGSIPPNLLAISNASAHDQYMKYCEENDFIIHPARFNILLPEFFIRFLTEPGDLVLDPFAGSCVSGAAAQKLNRSWICAEIDESYLLGAMGRFTILGENPSKTRRKTYEIAAPYFPTEEEEEPWVNRKQLPLLFGGDD